MDKFIKLTGVTCKDTLRFRRKYPFIDLPDVYIKREDLLVITSRYDNRSEEYITYVKKINKERIRNSVKKR